MLVDIIDRTAQAIRQWGIEAALTAVVVAKLAVPTLAGVLPGDAMHLHHRAAAHRVHESRVVVRMAPVPTPRVVVVSSRFVGVQARHALR